MKITIDNRILNEAIVPTLCALTPKSALSILSSVRLEASAEDRKLTLTGYDLQKGVTCTVDADVEEGGSLLLDGHRLSMIARSMPDGEMTLTSDDKYLTVLESGSSRFEISGSSSSEFPTLPTLSGERYFELSQGLLKKMLSQVLFSYALIDNKPALTGVYFDVDDDLLEICTCDGYRISLARKNIRHDAIDEKGNPVEPEMTCNFSDHFLVPGKNMAELFKLLEDSDKKIRIELARKHAIFCFEDKIFFSRLLEGEYLNYKSSIPKEYKTRIILGLDEFARAIDRAGLLTDEKVKTPVHFIVGEDALELKCATAQGRTHEVIKADVEGEQALLGFNHRFLADALKGAAISRDEQVELWLNSKLNGLLIQSPGSVMEEKEYFYLILPVKLN